MTIVTVVSIFVIAAACYAFLAPEWYRAKVLMAPADVSSVPSIGGQLGGLVALAGGELGADDSTEAVAVLKSRDFARNFIKDLDLLPVFFKEDWNSEQGKWEIEDSSRWPDSRDAVEYFHDHVLNVSSDRQSSLVTVTVDWKDPKVAATWANELVRRVNLKLRDEAIREAETNIEFLQNELENRPVVTLQQSIGRLVESEMQKLMLARGRDEFSFRVLDGAEAPKYPARPKKALIVFIGLLVGTVAALFGVLASNALRATRQIPDEN